MVLAPKDKVPKRAVDWGGVKERRMKKHYSDWAKAWGENGNQWKDKGKRRD